LGTGADARTPSRPYVAPIQLSATGKGTNDAQGFEGHGVGDRRDRRLRGPFREARGRIHGRLRDVPRGLRPADLFKGLPDDRCQSAHWGYVLKGKVAYRYGDREELYEAGDAYHAPPGHTPLFYADTEVVEFSPTESFDETTRVVTDNLRAAGVEAR
jgi:hypothetical protein